MATTWNYTTENDTVYAENILFIVLDSVGVHYNQIYWPSVANLPHKSLNSILINLLIHLCIMCLHIITYYVTQFSKQYSAQVQTVQADSV